MIKTDLESVYNAWTKSEELEKWFLSKAIFTDSKNNVLAPTSNVESDSNYEWNWFAQDAHEEGKVLKTNGIDLIEFTFAGKCKVQVKLTRENNQTTVLLTQTEIPLDDSSKENIRLGCAFGWSFYLVNLKSILEGGVDLRNKDKSLVGVVHN